MKVGLNLISRGFVKQGYLSDRYGLLAVIIWASGVCRKSPLVTCFSVSPMEKTEAQIQLTRGRVAPN
jgi:hypothetical protein